MPKLSWLVMFIFVWGIVHSVLASFQVKDFLHKILGDDIMRGYQAFYNIFAVVSFAPILFILRVLPDTILYDVPWPWRLIMFLGQGLAALCLVAALLQTDVLAFAGLRPILEGEKTAKLVTKGFYAQVRHPLYLFGLLILWLTPTLTLNFLALYISLTLYIIIGAYFEERKLMLEFGSAYTDYKSRTPMIAPIRFARKK